MRLLMVSGDRQVVSGEHGPFDEMLREFSRWFERIDVLCPRPDGEPRVLRVHENVHIHPADCSRGAQARFVAQRGEQLVREHGHALIVSHDYGRFANGIGSARLSRATGVPYVSELHHVPGHPVAADLRERAEHALARLYVRWARSRVRAFRVVNAVEMPQLLARWGVPREKIVVLPSLYLDLDVFRPAPVPVPLRYDVVFVGRMVVNKGVERIVDALALLASRGTKLRALFVGKGPRREAVRARVARRGLADACEFVEWVDSPVRLAEFYRASRVCVCASTCEGGPRFTVEALACGTPVVSTRVGVMPELLASGELGALCAFDVASLADAIGAQLADEPARLARGVRAVAAVQRFEYARAIRNYAAGLYALAGEELPAPGPERPR